MQHHPTCLMPKSKRKSLRRRVPLSYYPPRKTIVTLVIIDDEPFRQAAQAEYQTLNHEATGLRAALERFETEDLPAYERWEAQILGPLLSEQREINRLLYEKIHLLDVIQEYQYLARCSAAEAYRKIMAARDNPDPDPSADDPDPDEDDPFDQNKPRLFGTSDLPPDFDLEDFDNMTKAEQKKVRVYFESIAEMYNLVTGLEAPDFDEAVARERARIDGTHYEKPRREREACPFSPPIAVEQTNEKRRKALYRKIVRQLHPDANGEFTAHDRDLWEEAQSAYHAHDLERLEAVAVRIELGGGATLSSVSSLGMMLRIVNDLRQGLAVIRRELHKAKQQSAWNFQNKTTKLEKLEKQKRRAILIKITQDREELREISRALDDLARAAAPPPKKKSFAKKNKPAPPKSQPGHYETPYFDKF